MSAHLRLAHAAPGTQEAALLAIVRESPWLMAAFCAARELDLPDWWIVSGALYNEVWNALTGRAPGTGVKDVDLFFFDPDTSWEAEDRAIRRAQALFPAAPPVEPRNQARVHLWHEGRFGLPCEPCRDAREPIATFACRAHAVGLRLRADDSFDVEAPFGLGDIFAFRVAPNLARPNRATHEAKAARQKAIWPELEIVPWPT